MELIRILKAISDENRVRILNLLMNGELCVGEIELPKLNLYVKDKEKLKEYKSSGKTCLELKECN